MKNPDVTKQPETPTTSAPATGCAATPWQEGYMDGRAKSGDVLDCPHAMDSEEAKEWMQGFDAGRDDRRFGL